MSARQTFLGTVTIQGIASLSGTALTVNNSTPTALLTIANTGRLTISSDTTVTTQTSAVLTTGVTNANMVIAPNGTGALIAQVPTGTIAGGNSRGTNAIDFQMSRTAADQVVANFTSYSAILSGINNKVSQSYSVIVGGTGNTINFQGTFPASMVFGINNTAGGGRGNVTFGDGNTNSGSGNIVAGLSCTNVTGDACAVFGNQNNASGAQGLTCGFYGNAYLTNMFAMGAGALAPIFTAGLLQRSSISLIGITTGVVATTLLISNSAAAVINLNGHNAKVWTALVQLGAIVTTVGGGTALLNDTFTGTYLVSMKRVGNVVSIVGTVQVLNEASDTSMATSIVAITADNANYALQISYTPPTTAAALTQIRVNASVYITETGR